MPVDKSFLEKAFHARPLFDVVAHEMNSNVIEHDGPLGKRFLRAPKSGIFEGRGLKGTIAKGLATESQTQSYKQTTSTLIDGQMVLDLGSGEAILVKYRGRKSPASSYYAQIGAVFETNEGENGWLNHLTAIALLEIKGDDVHFHFQELVQGEQAKFDDVLTLKTDPLYDITANGAVGDRYSIWSPTGGRYMSVAERGATINGRLTGIGPEGFWWGSHRSDKYRSETLGTPFQVDLLAPWITKDNALLIQSYIGSVAFHDYGKQGFTNSWFNVGIFDAPTTGDYSYLNEVLVIGYGWLENHEVHYDYRILQ